MRPFFLWLLCAMSWSACRETPSPTPKIRTFPLVKTQPLHSQAAKVAFPIEAWYKVQYLGKPTRVLYFTEYPDSKYMRFDFRQWPRTPRAGDLQFKIDTNQRIIASFERGNWLAHPATFLNTSRDTLYISHGGNLDLTLQAKDQAGNWHDLQEDYYIMCGTGRYPIALPPNELAATSIPIPSGNFRTELRLVYRHRNDSIQIDFAPFAGNVDTAMFIKPRVLPQRIH